MRDMLEEIRGKMLRRHYEFSKHAVDHSIIRNISVEEVDEAISGRCEIIEDYADDRVWPELLDSGVYEDWTSITRTV